MNIIFWVLLLLMLLVAALALYELRHRVLDTINGLVAEVGVLTQADIFLLKALAGSKQISPATTTSR